jgi:hypothetical protein
MKYRKRFSAPSIVPLISGMLLSLLASNIALSADPVDERIKRLPPEQQELAQRMADFIVAMDAKYFTRIEKINGGGEDEGLIKTGEYSDYDIRVTRGPIVEKAGRMLAAGKKASPQGGPDNGELAWGRFFSKELHPKNPQVGLFNPTIGLQFFLNGN